MNEDGAAWRHSALLLVRRPSVKCPHTASHGGQGLSSSTLFDPSLVDLQSFDHGVEVGGRSEADVAITADDSLSTFGPMMPGAWRYAIPMHFSFSARAYTVFFLVSSGNSIVGQFSMGTRLPSQWAL